MTPEQALDLATAIFAAWPDPKPMDETKRLWLRDLATLEDYGCAVAAYEVLRRSQQYRPSFAHLWDEYGVLVRRAREAAEARTLAPPLSDRERWQARNLQRVYGLMAALGGAKHDHHPGRACPTCSLHDREAHRLDREHPQAEPRCARCAEIAARALGDG